MRCCDCGLIFLNRIDPEGERAKYETSVYRLIENENRLEFRKAVFEESLQEIARPGRPGRLLDVGCGNGFFWISLENADGRLGGGDLPRTLILGPSLKVRAIKELA